MKAEWVIIEVIAIFVEYGICLFFLYNRYQSKYSSYWPQLGTWGLLVLGGLASNISSFVAFSFLAFGIMFAYLYFFTYGTILQKAFGIAIVCSITIGTTIIGAGLASLIDSTTMEYALEYQDTSRMLAILFIKMLQVVIFYALAKKHMRSSDLQRRPALVLSGAAVIDFAYLFFIRIYAFSSDLRPGQYRLLIWLAIGALFILLAIFIIYELFIREEIKNVNLAMELQRLELESGFYKEIDRIYTELRIWQHDNKNNLSTLRALVNQVETEKALSFIDNMNNDVYKNQIMLQTGNLVLDAIVSSKLWLAQSQNIEVNIQAVYPENNYINDNDLCAIVGNLIDNAIEACARMGETNEKKFIEFTLMLKGKNLLISIKNSYNNELKRKGNRYLTDKKEPFHGIGLNHIDSIVKKYQGHVLRSPESGVFVTDILLPLL